jgi:branched-chain amino acid transport system ATP-binding protein
LDSVLELFPALPERLPERASHLSGGQQQMLAIARGLMLRPRLLLLDEPSLGIAPALVQEIFATLSRLRSNNVGILLVEQNARMSLNIADRGYVIETGRIVLDGPGRELVDRPEVVQRYLGGTAEGVKDTQASEVAAVGARIRAALVSER